MGLKPRILQRDAKGNYHHFRAFSLSPVRVKQSPGYLPDCPARSSAKLPAKQRVVVYLHNNDFMSIVESIRWCGFTARAQKKGGMEQGGLKKCSRGELRISYS